MVSLFDEYVGKQIVAVLTNGFRKFGKLLAVDSDFIKIEFNDGKQELINKKDIVAMKLDDNREARL